MYLHRKNISVFETVVNELDKMFGGIKWNNYFMNKLKKISLKPETKYTKVQTLQWWKHIGILERVSWNSRAERERLSMVPD